MFRRKNIFIIKRILGITYIAIGGGLIFFAQQTINILSENKSVLALLLIIGGYFFVISQGLGASNMGSRRRRIY